MNAKSLILILSVVALGFTSCSNVTQTNATLKTETDTASFYLGYFMGMQMEQLGFDVNRSAYLAGFNSAMAGKESPEDLQKMDMFVNTQIQAASMKKADKKLDEGKKFLEENGKKSGVITTESGLQYKIETEGSGATPADTSIVKVHYRGTLLNGKEFDSSYSRGEPTEFPANRVIPGWTEALQLMSVGSKWTLYIPSDLAYGQRGAGGMIGPNETLIFEVELLEIVNPDEE